VANVYPTFTYADYPERWAPDAPEQLQKNCIEYRKSLYLWFESQLKAAPFALGERLTLLDVYIAVARTWGHATTGLRPIRRNLRRLRTPYVSCRNCTRC
jgi:GST-like protein